MGGALASGLQPLMAVPSIPGESGRSPLDTRSLIPAQPEALRRFLGYRYGAFIHWGPASVLGKEISWSREVETPSAQYDKLYERFNPTQFDAEEWVRMLKESGFRYLTFVTKHHEGFAMWNTKTTDHNIMNSPFRRDILKEIAAACRRQKLPLCLYYSIADFYQPDCAGASNANGLYLGPPGYALPNGEKPDFDRYVKYMKAQLRELSQNYGPVVAWWFDGGWQREWTQERGVELLRFMRSLQADTLTDQRVGCAYNGRVYMPTWFPTDRDHVGDFAVLEVDMPRFNRDIPWEYTTPANGRSYCWTPGPYGNPDAWIDNLVKSACGDGNYLLGLTPPSSGRFDPALVDKLQVSSVWLKRYGESIFETRGGPFLRTNVYGSTCKGNRIYLHVFDTGAVAAGACWPTCAPGQTVNKNPITLTLPPLNATITRFSMLNGGKVDVVQNAKGIQVTISPNDLEMPDTIVVLDLDKDATTLAPLGEIPVNRGVPVRSSNTDPAGDQLVANGNIEDFWKSDGRTRQPWLEFDLQKDRTLSRATLFEGAYEGELANIHRYQIEVKTQADHELGIPWKRIADVTTWGFETSQEEDFFEWPISVFHPEVRFEPVSARYVRLKILKSVDTPAIHEFELHER